MNAPATFARLRAPAARLSSNVTLNYETRRYETWCEFQVEYRFDGEAGIDLITVRPLDSCDLDQFTLDELVASELLDSGIAYEAYAEWQAEQAEHFHDLAREAL